MIKFNRVERTRFFKYTVVFVLLLLATAIPLAQTGSVPDYGSAFQQVWKETRDRFYDKHMHGVNWETVGENYRASAREARNLTEFQTIVNRMLGELHASHLGYFTKNDIEYYLLPAVFRGEMDSAKVGQIGVTGDIKTSCLKVRAVLDGSPAAKAGIRVGDELNEAGGEPFATVGPFQGREGSSLLVTADRPGAGRMTFVVKPVAESPQRYFLAATKKSVHVIDRDGKHIGYIHLWCMTNDQFRQAFEEALTGELSKTDGLIIDMRDGFGGTPFGYTDILMRPSIEWDEERRGERSSRHSGYGKPVVVLTNGGTRSAKEFFCYQLKKAHRATLIGTRTAGAFLGASGVPIGTDGYLEVPVTGLKVDGAKLEGHGVDPDITVADSDTYGPNDAQLKRAVEVLASKISAVRT